MNHVPDEQTFAQQIATVLRVAEQLKGRWVIQKFKYGRWEGLWIFPTIPENPIAQKWAPFSRQPKTADFCAR